MVSEAAVLLSGISVGAVALVIAVWKEYLHRRRTTVAGFQANAKAPVTVVVEATAPAAPPPSPPSASSGFSFAPATIATRTPLASRRYGGAYVRRTAPRRNTATRRTPEDKPS